MTTTTTTYALTFPASLDGIDAHCAHILALNCFVPQQVLEDVGDGDTQRVTATAEPEVFDRYEAMLTASGVLFEVEEQRIGAYDLNILEGLCTQWASDRSILQNGAISGQSKKLGEEFGELIDGLLRGDLADTEDAIGDMIVVLNNIAVMSGSSLTKCLNGAYNEIKNRRGTLMPDGTFKKEVK